LGFAQRDKAALIRGERSLNLPTNPQKLLTALSPIQFCYIQIEDMDVILAHNP